ncbi:MAG TPA: c-type cytochrome biogenesis protein CcsB [Candidatus Limnocylindrales bacterium]|nr:c-type cytochrome biogenesis protein CcsB [Candidatus Limnocylindrales bacterium]
MEKMSGYAFVAAILMTALAMVCYYLYAISGLRASRVQTAGGPTSAGPLGIVSGPRTAAIGRYASVLGWLAVAALLASLVFRTIATGHGPFANMYEFSVAFAFGILGAYMWFEHKYHQRVLALIVFPVSLGMMLYAWSIQGPIEPLVPALQNNMLLTVHVAVAIVAYGSFAIAFASSYMFLLQTRSALPLVLATVAGVVAVSIGGLLGSAPIAMLGGLAAFVTVGVLMAIVVRLTGDRQAATEESGGRWGLPKPFVLDEIGYRAVVIGFPFLTLTIILGAVWAETAWGTYWSWDPKETASLVTWLIYGAYLHARVMRGWRGTRAAWLLVVGFIATLFTYFGNLIFGGLHSYSGLG